MPNLKTWQRALIEEHGEVQGAMLAARAQARYEELYNQILRVSLLAYPQQGWDIGRREDSESSFAFDIHRCFYLDVLTAYGAQELTAIFCQLDDLAYAALTPSIRWERTKTLGRGNDCCDFRWSRGESTTAASGLIQVQAGTRTREVSRERSRSIGDIQ